MTDVCDPHSETEDSRTIDLALGGRNLARVMRNFRRNFELAGPNDESLQMLEGKRQPNAEVESRLLENV